MRIAIVGAGAMGQLFGTKLASAGHDVVMIDAFDSVVRSINERGLSLRMGDVSTNVAVRASLAADEHEVVDLVLVFTKTMHSQAALDSVAHLIAPHTLGMSVQNGLGNEVPLTSRFGVSRTVIGMTDYPADRSADGTIYSEPTGTIVVGGLTPEATDQARGIVAMFNRADLHTTLHPDVMVPIWEKVIFNAVLNTVSAVSGMTVGAMAKELPAQRLAEAVVSECFAVAHAEGILFDEERVRSSMRNAYTHHGEHKTSMLADLEAGRPTEVESIGGAICALGEKRGVLTPVLSVLSEVVRARSLVEITPAE